MQTIGERLEEARKKKGISIREAAEATKIRGDYLQKFESNHFDIGLTEIYARGFLRNYANFLKLPADRILNDYSALGRGEVRPRQPNREVYGRLDISVATASETTERPSPAEEKATPAPAEPNRSPTRYPRSSSALPTGLDPATVFKYAKWVGVGVVVLLLAWIVKSLFSVSGSNSNKQAAANNSAPTSSSPPVAEKVITLVALDVVRVSVKQNLPDGSEGEELFVGTLTRGQRQVVPWTGPIYISASAGQNLEVEYQGKRYPTGFTGANRAKM